MTLLLRYVAGVGAHPALDRGISKTQAGGFLRLDRIFEGDLESLLSKIHNKVWKEEA